jgi:hypothetical protein
MNPSQYWSIPQFGKHPEGGHIEQPVQVSVSKDTGLALMFHIFKL